MNLCPDPVLRRSARIATNEPTKNIENLDSLRWHRDVAHPTFRV